MDCLLSVRKLLVKNKHKQMLLKNDEGAPLGLKDVNRSFLPFDVKDVYNEVSDIESRIIKPLYNERYR